jgi:hypothetical protein
MKRRASEFRSLCGHFAAPCTKEEAAPTSLRYRPFIPELIQRDRYTASAALVPVKYRGRVGFVVGWLNILGGSKKCLG